MSLSPVLQDLKAREQDYEASEATKEKLKGKILTAIIAPTAVGKSTLIKRALEIGGQDFCESYSIVTRPRRATDPPEYKTKDEGYTIERVKAMIDAKELTHYTIHPSGNIYGSLPESFPALYNFLPCVPSILGVVEQAGFTAIHKIYIVASPSDWVQRLTERRDDPSYTSRLREACESLSWAIECADELTFVENVDGGLDDAAQIICDITSGQPHNSDSKRDIKLTQAMLTFAQNELQRA